MPATLVLFYREDDAVPVRDWLEELQRYDRKGFAKCTARIRELGQLGHELRRPAADILRDGIYELRARQGNVQYRMLYFFHGRNVTVLAHALVKEGSVVPPIDIERAVWRRKRFLDAPAKHSLEA